MRGQGIAQVGIGAMVLILTQYTPAAADRLLVLGGINLGPLTDQVCREAPTSTNSIGLEETRGKLLASIEKMDANLFRARQKMAEAEHISNTFARSIAQALDQVAKLEAAMKVDAMDEAGKQTLGQLIQSAKVRVRREMADVLDANSNMEKAGEELVEADSRVHNARPGYLKAVQCVEKRLAELRQAPPPIATSRGSCKLQSMDWQTTTQLRLNIAVDKGSACEQPVTGSGNVVASEVRLFILPQNGAAEMKSPTTVVYRPNPGYAGADRIGLMMQTSQGTRTAVINITVQ